MYDLLNEPMCDVQCTEIERRIKNEKIYTRLYNTVRAVDEDHIITMEAIWTGFALIMFLKMYSMTVNTFMILLKNVSAEKKRKSFLNHTMKTG